MTAGRRPDEVEKQKIPVYTSFDMLREVDLFFLADDSIITSQHGNFLIFGVNGAVEWD